MNDEISNQSKKGLINNDLKDNGSNICELNSVADGKLEINDRRQSKYISSQMAEADDSNSKLLYWM